MYQAKVTIGHFGRTWFGKVRKYRWLAQWDCGSTFSLRSIWYEVLTDNFHEPGLFMIYEDSPIDEERIS